MQTVEYAPNRSADLFGEPSQPTVLIWHGMQPDSRAAVRPLAQMLAERGAHVVVPDWNSHADDGGRADLLGSLDFTRDRDSHTGLVVVGWSMGGAAAAGLALHANDFGVSLAHTVCLAGAFMATDPLSGTEPLEALPADGIGSPFLLLHGIRDDAVPVAVSQSFASRLTDAGWPVELVEMDADHGSIAGATYDTVNRRYDPATDGETLAVASDVAVRIARVLPR